MDCVLGTLHRFGSVELLVQYAYGKQYWHDEGKIEKLDDWIDENRKTIIDWAFAMLRNHPAELAMVSV